MASSDPASKVMRREADDPLLAPVVALLLYGVLFFVLGQFFPAVVKWSGLPQLYFLLAALWIMHRQKVSFAALGFRRQGIAREFLFGCLAALIPLTVILVLLIFLHFSVLTTDVSANRFLLTPSRLYHLFILLLLAPICEELFFRGMIARVMKDRIKPYLLIPLVALLFTAAHFGWYLGPFLLGLATTWLFIWRNSLVAPLLLHMVCNAFGPALLAFAPQVYQQLRIFFL